MSTDYRDVISLPELPDKAAWLTAGLAAQAGLLERYPTMAYADALAVDRGGYKHIPAEHRQWSHDVERRFGRDTLERYHQLLLLNLIERFGQIVDSRSYQYPDSVLPQFRRFFSSIVRRIAEPLQGHFVLGESIYDKDLGVASQNLVPCGAQLVDRASGIARSSLVKAGLANGWRLSRFLISRIGGIRPLYQLHMEQRLLLEFNPRGWAACYRRIAELMMPDAQIRGVCGGSWWFDPQLGRITPRLGFLHDLPVQNGAGVFRMGSEEMTTQDALTNSPQRKRLYDEGTYQPQKYLMVWGRDDMLAWALKQQRSLERAG